MPDDLAPRGYYEGLTARSLMADWARREQSAGSKSECKSTCGVQPRRGLWIGSRQGTSQSERGLTSSGSARVVPKVGHMIIGCPRREKCFAGSAGAIVSSWMMKRKSSRVGRMQISQHC
jgi:hypothetical protein